MKRTLLVAALSASAFGFSAQASFADYELNILHMYDWHSRIESNNKYESTCSDEDETKGACIGGAARLVTAVRQEREKLKDQNVIFLNAGDNFQGSLFFTTYHGAAEAEVLQHRDVAFLHREGNERDGGQCLEVRQRDVMFLHDESDATHSFDERLLVEIRIIDAPALQQRYEMRRGV